MRNSIKRSEHLGGLESLLESSSRILFYLSSDIYTSSFHVNSGKTIQTSFDLSPEMYSAAMILLKYSLFIRGVLKMANDFKNLSI